MEGYQKLFQQAQELVGNHTDDISGVLQEVSTQSDQKVLFIDGNIGEAIYNGTTYSFNLSNPELLDSLLQKHQVRYLVLVDAVTDPPSNKLLPVPDRLRPKENWNIHLWELYLDFYFKNNKGNKDVARLRVLYYALLLSQQDMFRVQYFNNSLVNIFGWLFCSTNRMLSDLYLDMRHAYEE